MRSMTFIAAAGLALLAGAGSASAALLSTVPQTASVPLTSTTWSTTLSFAKFDPTLGTLVDVRFQLAGSVVGDIKFESLDAAVEQRHRQPVCHGDFAPARLDHRGREHPGVFHHAGFGCL